MKRLPSDFLMTVNASSAIPGCVRYLWTKSAPVRTGQFLIGSITKDDIYQCVGMPHRPGRSEAAEPIVPIDESPSRRRLEIAALQNRCAASSHQLIVSIKIWPVL